MTSLNPESAADWLQRPNLLSEKSLMELGPKTLSDIPGIIFSNPNLGLVEYTLIVVLVALVFWVAIKNTNVGSQFASGWSKVTTCVGDPADCTSCS